VGLDVFDVDRTRVSASDQTLEVLAGNQQITLEAVHQLQNVILEQRSKKKTDGIHLGCLFVRPTRR